MGLRPGDEVFAARYEYLTEYATTLRDLFSTNRKVGTFVLIMLIAAEAFARWEHDKAGADQEALARLGLQAAANTRSDAHIKEAVNPVSAINLDIGTLVGSDASIARMRDEMATVPGTSGALLTFDDFGQGTEDFGTRIQPLMTTRRQAMAAA